MKTIGIVGSRRRNTTQDFNKVKEAFLKIYTEDDRIVSGGCPQGADNFAELIAKTQQVPITIHYAQWNKHGNSAGFLRNGDIADQADVLIACVDPFREGGTEDTIKKFRQGISEETMIQAGKLILV